MRSKIKVFIVYIPWAVLSVNFPVVISVMSCLKFHPINLNIMFVYIIVLDYDARK